MSMQYTSNRSQQPGLRRLAQALLFLNDLLTQ